MSTIQSHRQLWGRDFPLHAEWDAGYTPPHTPSYLGGRWSVRREAARFIVFFHRFQNQTDTLLAEYPPTEEGEIEAKTFAQFAQQTHLIPPQS